MPVGVIAVPDPAGRGAYFWAALRSHAIGALNAAADFAIRVAAFRRLAPTPRAETTVRTPVDLTPSVKHRDEMIRQGLLG
jgi:hypothetical protein